MAEQLIGARRRRLQPDLPAQRDGVRLVPAAAGGHRGQQPHRHRAHPRRGPAAERRVAVAAAGARADISRAFLAALEADREAVHDQAFNIGRDEDVVQIRDIAEAVAERMDAPVTFAEGAAPDKRDYRVDFAKVAARLPGLPARSGRSPDGIDELATDMEQNGLSAEDFEGPRFVRLEKVNQLRAAGRAGRPARHEALTRVDPGRRPTPAPGGRAARMRDRMERLYPLLPQHHRRRRTRTLAVLAETMPARAHAVPSGTAGASTGPINDEWNVRDAYIADPDGRRLVDFRRPHPAPGQLQRARSRPDDARGAPPAPAHAARPSRLDPLPHHLLPPTWGFCLTHAPARGDGGRASSTWSSTPPSSPASSPTASCHARRQRPTRCSSARTSAIRRWPTTTCPASPSPPSWPRPARPGRAALHLPLPLRPRDDRLASPGSARTPTVAAHPPRPRAHRAGRRRAAGLQADPAR